MRKDLNLKWLSQLNEACKPTTLVKVTSKGLQKCPSSEDPIIKRLSLWIYVCLWVCVYVCLCVCSSACHHSCTVISIVQVFIRYQPEDPQDVFSFWSSESILGLFFISILKCLCHSKLLQCRLRHSELMLYLNIKSDTLHVNASTDQIPAHLQIQTDFPNPWRGCTAMTAVNWSCDSI